MTTEFLHGVEVVQATSGTRPIRVARSSVIGIVGTAPGADADAFPLDTPVLIAGSRAEAAKLFVTGSTQGTLPLAVQQILAQTGALIVVVRVAPGADLAANQAAVIGGVSGVTGFGTGLYALIDAKSRIGFQPRIIIAPGFTGAISGGTKNPVAAAIETVCDRLNAISFIAGPNTTDSAAITAATLYGNKRLMMVDPFTTIFDALSDDPGNEDIDGTATAAGIQARVDNELGFWWSCSNQPANGVLNISRPIDFTLGDPNSRANLLNEANVTTFIREGGWRLWGNRTLSSDAKWAFLSVVRTADIINDSILAAHLWAVDRPISRVFADEVAEGVNNFLRELQSRGAILGGTCWLDPDLNTPAVLESGRIYFNFDFTPPYPAERITFTSILTNGYAASILE